MKNLAYITIIIAALGFQSCSKKSEVKVPEAVKDGFTAKFADGHNVIWDKENDTDYEAEFEMEGRSYSAIFDMYGIWKATEYEISEDDIPAEIYMVLDENFSDFEIQEVEKGETTAGTFYEFELSIKDEVFEVTVNSDGSVTKEKIPDEHLKD